MVVAAGMAALLGLMAPVAGAAEFDLSFNDSAVQTGFTHVIEDRNLRLGGGILHNEDAGDVFRGELMVTGKAADVAGPLTAGVGGQLLVISGDGNNRDGFGLAVGGMAKYVFPQHDRFSARAEVWYMPDILTGEDADQYAYYLADFGYAITRQADVYVGARYVKAEFDNASSLLFDTGMHIGINLRF